MRRKESINAWMGPAGTFCNLFIATTIPVSQYLHRVVYRHILYLSVSEVAVLGLLDGWTEMYGTGK